METFEYSIIRYVPRVEREEFINIGVIVFAKRKDFLEMKYAIPEEKVRAIGEEEHISLLEDYLETWKNICEGRLEGGKIAALELPYRFRWLAASKSTIIQTSKPHPGRCDNPRLVLEALYKKYVA